MRISALAGPGGRGVEHGDQLQALGLGSDHDAIPLLPAELRRSGLDLGPGKGLPHPVEATSGELLQGLV